jgi:hypothetical protein
VHRQPTDEPWVHRPQDVLALVRGHDSLHVQGTHDAGRRFSPGKASTGPECPSKELLDHSASAGLRDMRETDTRWEHYHAWKEQLFH